MPILIRDQNSIDSLGNKINTNDSLVFAPAMVLGSIITINLLNIDLGVITIRYTYCLGWSNPYSLLAVTTLDTHKIVNKGFTKIYLYCNPKGARDADGYLSEIFNTITVRNIDTSKYSSPLHIHDTALQIYADPDVEQNLQNYVLVNDVLPSNPIMLAITKISDSIVPISSSGGGSTGGGGGSTGGGGTTIPPTASTHKLICKKLNENQKYVNLNKYDPSTINASRKIIRVNLFSGEKLFCYLDDIV